MSELRAQLTALKTSEGEPDLPRLRYIESLLQRAERRGGRLAEVLNARAREAMQDYRQHCADRPRNRKGSAHLANQPLRQLNELFDSLREEQNDPHILPLEAALRQQELELVEAIAEETSAPRAAQKPPHDRLPQDRLPQARQQELKAARKFHAAMVQLNADTVVNRALAEVSPDAGPLNPQRLATRSLTAMRDLSPHYLSRFVSYIDTLFWLEQAGKNSKR